MDLLASAAEQGRAKQSELVVESFFLHSYGTFKQCEISETIDFFFCYGLWEKKMVDFLRYNRDL